MELGKTPIKVDSLRHYLKIYPNRDDAFVLLDGFTSGFRVNYTDPRIAFNCKNVISAEQHEAELNVKMSKEIEAGLIARPFQDKPFSNLRLSPIGLVVKKPSGWRMIPHLSCPLGNSVNSYIDPELAIIQYASFDKVLSTISEIGRGDELARMDILSAFRLLILHPDEFELFGFHFKNQFILTNAYPWVVSRHV